MPKMKTHKGAAKRFRVTGTGKVMRGKAYSSHILTKKSPKRKRNFRQDGLVSAADTSMVLKKLGRG
ncbi:MAG: 50S ribosomal protein L35 [Coriobacteriia bacterium]|jgi:large subunit ribosomal protein L35|nr:50S ribosomal protein L35 [Coriobacteriia bacterium]